ncbi:MAG: alpha/beta hydrolase [Chloroflexota bacterium]|nr:alpha/beta hydrolase [Chloroflexota bacterium]
MPEHANHHLTNHPIPRLLTRRTILGVTGAALTGVALGTAAHRIAAAQDATPGEAAGDVAGLFDIGGGRRLYLECRGTGGPTVILEAGYRSPLDVWTEDLVSPEVPRTMVFEGVSAHSRTCVYERPGVASVIDGVFRPSRSDAVPMPRTATDAVQDLHALLDVAGVAGPYVLVGHSFGGLIVRLYASTYPDEVAGVVLVDALSEYVREELATDEWASYQRVVSAVPPELADYSDLETMDMDASFDQMVAAAGDRPLAGIPLAVISAGLPFGIPEGDLGFSPDRLQEAWAASQNQLAALVPDTPHIVATESAHYVQLEQPDLVIDAVMEVVNAAKP